MAIDRQADVVLTSSAGMVASTKLLPLALKAKIIGWAVAPSEAPTAPPVW